VKTFAELFQGRQRNGCWTFELGERFNGAFGGTNGGVAAAVSLHAALGERHELMPAAIDCHFLKGCRPGMVTVITRLLSEGRTLTVIATETLDHTGSLCTTALVTLVNPDRLEQAVRTQPAIFVPADHSTEPLPWQHPKGHRIPLIDTFAPEIVASSDDSTTTRIHPGFDVRVATAEAVCIAADISVGPPVGRAVRGRASLPNPNLALRFSGARFAGSHLQSNCRLVQIEAGLACTEIRVGSDEILLGTGTSMTTCLPLPGFGNRGSG